MASLSDLNCLLPLPLNKTFYLTICLNLVLASTMVVQRPCKYRFLVSVIGFIFIAYLSSALSFKPGCRIAFMGLKRSSVYAD